jgi:DNA-binding response OmpR family regulator
VPYPPRVAARILVIEDDETIGANLVRALKSEGWHAEVVRSGAGALDAARARSFDLMLLDLGLPDVDGIELCADLRIAQPAVTLIMLTARAEEIDIVVGLDAGADDYVTKPFRLAELLARLRAHLRRGAASTSAAPATITAGDLTIDGGARRAWVGDRELELRPKEFELLAYLAASAGQALTRESIMSDVWDEHWWGSTKTLDIHISALRRKLGEDGREPSRISTLRGVGYRFDPR